MILFLAGAADTKTIRVKPGRTLIRGYAMPMPWQLVAGGDNGADVVTIRFVDGLAEGVDPAVAEYLIASKLADRNVGRYAASLLLKGAKHR